jgi:hypothetical protein
MNNTYEVHCSGLRENELEHDYDIKVDDSNGLALYYSNEAHWEAKTRKSLALNVVEFNGFAGIYIEGIKKPIQLDASQEEQLLIALLYRNDTKIQIKESKIIKEI